MKFIHTADWQLGKAFGRFQPEVRAALTEARFDAIDAIGRAATDQGVDHVLVAGDIFDTEGPGDRTIVQAISRMERHPCRWWLLPGNHDFVRNDGLWDRVRKRASDRIVVLSEARPHEIEPGSWLLPAPLTYRLNLDDPTEAFDAMDTPGARLRIGLAHGSIRDFGSQGEAGNQIAPDRARRSNLDYLALGDWHGVLEVDAWTWYSGTPETDRFKRDAPGYALLVDLEPGRAPQVSPIQTGRFRWITRDWIVSDLADFDAQVEALLGTVDPSASLLKLSLSGITNLGDRSAILSKLEDEIAHRLRDLEVRASELVVSPTREDLDTLAVEGVLGVAAAKLNARIEAGGPDAALARRALERLFVEYSRGEIA
ncbi:DNA repair exonuclease [Lysobacter sp. CCNWLW3]|uniref:metallophosphoesterase family protein n=1 Tax=unclassified Lysobacter TaxID=2635362 RepID=UPI002FD57CF5